MAFLLPFPGGMVSLSLHEYAPVPARIGARYTSKSKKQEPAPNRRSLLCLALPAPRLPQRARSGHTGGIVSVLLHVVVVTAVVFLAAWSRSIATSPEATSNRKPMQLPRMVFLQTPGPNGGGGGGGTRQSTRPSRAQAVGRDHLAIPVAKPVIASEQPEEATPPPQQVVLEAKALASGATLITGLPDAASSLQVSQGIGSGGGVGDGRGTGIGSGSGSGMGPGSGGAFGGGAYARGSGVSAPTLLTQVKPRYTAEALQRKIQGEVALAVIVGREGIPVAIRVTRSLDPGGLDEEAIAAVQKWRFTPGRLGDTPVDVLVTIFIDFRIV